MDTFNQSVYNISGIYKLFENSNEDALLQNIQLKISAEDLNRIPANGSFITICNRPVGGIEEILLSKIIHSKRPDFFFLNNIFLKDMTNFHKNFIMDNSLLSVGNMCAEGHGVGLFPVGNISEFQAPHNASADSRWDKLVVKSALDANTSILPIYISIEDESIFKLLGMIHPIFITRKVISDIIANNGLKATIRIGRPLRKQHFTNFTSLGQCSRFLRAKLYSLSSQLAVESFFETENETVIDEVSTHKIECELAAIADTNMVLKEGDFEVYLAKAKKIPSTIVEIGRLREITFRGVGEGTNKSVDLDEFDLYYLHLFLWDTKHKKIAGAYRMGVGSYIMKTIGKRGFYLRTLFKMKKPFDKVLENAIELGRSFIREEYQNKRLPLFLLWKSIAAFMQRTDNAKYMIGPVSISKQYSSISRSVMVRFIMQYYWDIKLAKHIKPMKEFRPKFEGLDVDILMEGTKDSLHLMDDVLKDVDVDSKKMPVLLKKYFKQNAKIIGFNEDPNFNDALDGFMIVKTEELTKEYL